MKTTTVPDAPSETASGPEGQDSPLMVAVQAVDRFFFQPSEPTALGLMRIATGILVLYVHLVYCIGLTNYVGPYAWVSNEYTRYIRNDYPSQAPSSNWKDLWIESDGEVYSGQ